MLFNLNRCRLVTFDKRQSILRGAYAMIFLFLFFFSYVSFSQQNQIDSLKKILSLSHDTAKVDCLNNLSAAFIILENKDSAKHYANLAFIEAKKINYIHGI